MSRSDPEHDAVQRDYFARAEPEHFAWATAGAGFCEAEDEVLAPFLSDVASPCLEIGCGEGANLARLRQRVRCFGVDLFPAKAAFAARQLPDVGIACAHAAVLPFADASFATVFVRDLLHHLADPRAAVEEAVRVLAPGGLLCVIEPNASNPLEYVHSFVVPAERGIRRSTAEHLRGLLEGLPLAPVQVRTHFPLALRRLVLHYKMGFPSLGRHPRLRRLLAAAERGLGRLLPPSRWTYVVVTARRAP